jgi:hypothetical protein
MASARSLPALTYAIDEDMLANMTWHLSAEQIDWRGARAAIRLERKPESARKI